MTHRAPARRPGRATGRGLAATAAPFSLVDELSCYYDTHDEPNNVHLEVRLAAAMEQQRLCAAVSAALTAMPAARGRRASGSSLRRSYTWEYPAKPDVEPVTISSWTSEADLDRLRTQFLATAPSLDTSPPVRLLLAAGPAGTSSLMLKAHHAALDGLSCLALLRDVAVRYASLAAPQEGSASGLDRGSAQPDAGHDQRPSDLLSGFDTGQPAQSEPANRPSLRARRPARIATSHAPGPAGRRGGYGLLLLPLRPVPAVPAAAVRPTLNDVLITALAVTIAGWNAKHGKPARAIKITMPVNARRPDQQQAAGNLSRLVTVTIRSPDRSMLELLADVSGQTRSGRNQPGPQVGGGLSRLARAWCPVGVKRLLVRGALRTVGPLVCDTAMLTNLGNVADPPRPGAAAPVSMAFSTSAHMPRGLSVGAISVGGQLQLAVRYRYALLDDAAAARFGASLGANLTALTDVPANVRESRPDHDARSPAGTT